MKRLTVLFLGIWLSNAFAALPKANLTEIYQTYKNKQTLSQIEFDVEVCGKTKESDFQVVVKQTPTKQLLTIKKKCQEPCEYLLPATISYQLTTKELLLGGDKPIELQNPSLNG